MWFRTLAFPRGLGWAPFLVAALVACKDKSDKNAPVVTPSAAPNPLSACLGETRVDPTTAELRPAIRAFRQKHYKSAQKQLETLAKQYPVSAKVQRLLGSTILYDKALSPVGAADAALRHYAEAQRFHEAGCELRESDLYYLRMDTAYAHLRKDDMQAALAELELAKRAWPDSAEVFYTLARAHCALKQVAECANNFEETLVLAKALKRPHFLRTHRSLDDWIRRSRDQSELGPLRDDPRYDKIIAKLTASK